METITPPHSIEAEQNILGGLLMEPEILSSITDLVRTEDFYSPRHRLIFDIMKKQKAQNRPADIVHVTTGLKELGELQTCGGHEYLMKLIEGTISASRIESYCEILKQKSIQRGLITSCKEIQTRSFQNTFKNIDELVDFALKEMQNIDNSRSSKDTLVDVLSVMKTVIPEIEARAKSGNSLVGISSGFQNIDSLTLGFKPSELIIAAARPSMGKTAFSLNLAYNMAVTSRKRIAYFSVEMPKETLVLRMLASAAGIDLGRLQSGQIRDNEWSKLIDRASKISDTELYIDDSNPLSPAELRSRCRYLKHTKGLDCVMVDYLQLMRSLGKAESREREVAEISSTLKSVAKELKIPVIALAQLNREADKRDGNRPVISDLRDSGSIEMDADVIMMLLREDYYNKDDPSIAGHAEIIVGKNRNGKTGVAKMKFIAELNRFEDRASY
jgi:replicative DNA helicase